MSTTAPRTGSAHYDDENLNYADYWTSRTYEHQAEVMAVRRLLRGHAFEHAADIGGGYGRLSVVLADYARRVTLVDPPAAAQPGGLRPGRAPADQHARDERG